jgi:DNA-binding transcriptional MerR regulator
MTDSALFTLREIADALSLPESTVRYYRDAFAPHIPTVGSGRRRRYPEDAVQVLRSIAHGYASGKPRSEIEDELLGAPSSAPLPPALSLWPRRAMNTEEVLATILDGERERREAMWQMARELVRLGDAVARQHVALGDLIGRLEQMGRALPPGAPSGVPAAATAPEPVVPEDPPSGSGARLDGDVARELEALREELANERELVERLRRSKLDIERRAAEAEALLDAPARERRRGVLGRWLGRDGPRAAGDEEPAPGAAKRP